MRTLEKPYLVINDRTGKLCQEFRDFLFDLLSPEYIPHDYYRGGHYMDWKILGKYYNCFFYKAYLGDEEEFVRSGYQRRPEDLTFEQWIKYIPIIRKWIHFLSKRVFDPITMLINTSTTDKVCIRIAVSQLNDWDLPRDFKDYIFDNMLDQYYTRKRVFDIYYYAKIKEIPFY